MKMPIFKHSHYSIWELKSFKITKPSGNEMFSGGFFNHITMNTKLRFLKINLLATISLLAIGCMNTNSSILDKVVIGNGKVIVEQRTVHGNFDKIQVTSGIEVEIEQADDYEIVVEADENIMPYLLTEMDEDVLDIHFDNVSITNYKEAKVRVKTPRISELKSTSTAEIKVKNKIQTQNLTLYASSAGEIEIGELTVRENLKLSSSSTAEINIKNIKAKNIETSATSSADIEIDKIKTIKFLAESSSSADMMINDIEADKIRIAASSGSEVKLKGETAEFSAEASSTATVNAKELQANRATVSASSSAEILVYPIDSLKAQASSSGDVYYYNEPATLVEDTSSAGSVEKK